MRHLSLALIAFAAIAHAQPEPTHEGKPLSEWVELMNQNPGNHIAVRALGEIGEPALPHLIAAMRSHPDGAIRFLTQVALAKIGEPALPELDRIMEDGDSTARIQAILAFEKILGERAIPRLEAATQDQDQSVQTRAHGAMIRVGHPREQHVAAMVELLSSANVGTQWITAESLGWCGADAAGAEDALYEVTQRSPGGVADRAWQALEDIGTEAAMSYVHKRWAESLDNPDTPRSDSLRGLIALGKSGESAAGALPKLREVADDTDRDILIRGYAAWAADQIDPYTGEPRVFHVAQNHPNARDGNPGTEDEPWLTIQKAAGTLNAGDTVLIHDGLYREEVRPFCGGAGPDRMITYAAAPGESPVIAGSDVWDAEWTGEEHHIWWAPYERHAWDRPEEWPTPKEGPMHRAEQVFVNGDLMTHVATLDELRATPESMFTDDEQGRLYLHISLDVLHADLLIERSMRQQVFAPAARGLGYIRVQGLAMRHAAAPESNGSNWGVIAHRAMLSVRAGHHWVIEDNSLEWGNAQGLDVGGEGFGEINTDEPRLSDEMGHHIARRNTVSYHGVAGIVGWAGGTAELLLEDNVTNYNCQKGNFWQYEAAGVKLHNAKDCTIRRHRAHGNHAFGIWLDHRCVGNRITQCILTENMASGVFHEVSAGPILIDNNVIIGTTNANAGGWG
ncbi:MAG TPA: HEAT repeat domain-containing protein, partial [Armatimonadota bacterium]|nr:HEAT repeat domain-containing protein [Armatimonadota bacterium]